MARSLKAIAKEINDSPALGLRATVKQSQSSTDTRVAGTRFRRQGKGRRGLKITVTLVRTGKPVCSVDTSETYRSAQEVEEWLSEWKLFWRKYKGAGNYGQYFVEGELHPSRGHLMTVGQLKKLAGDALIWARIKKHDEDYHRTDGVCRFERNGANYIIDGMSFDFHDPRDDETISWVDDEHEIRFYQVRLTKYKYVEKK